MTENQTAHQPVAPETSVNQARIKENERRPKGDSHKIIVVIVLACMILAGGFYILNIIQNIRQSAQASAEVALAQVELTNARMGELDKKTDEISSQQEAMSSSIAALYRQQPGNNEDWALAEIEYLLIIAAHRLLLEQDINTALAAMNAADLRLRDMDNPDLIPVREQLAADINQLKSVDNVDITGLSIYLADLIERASDLPLKQTVMESPEEQSGQTDIPAPGVQEQRSLLSTVWQEIKELVVIKRSGETRQVLLLPDQEYFLYQNLRLELENARLAVMRRDTENLQTSVNLLKQWLAEYFDVSDVAVINIMETLDRMSALDLKPEMPDINSSLETLRAFMHGQNTAGATSEAPSS